jgi:mono/diheme cytochrome c family protein
MVRALPIFLLAAALSSAARGQTGSVPAGLSYAEAVCAECHAVRRGSLLSPNLNAPPFEKIANTPGVTGAALYVILQTAHREMPDLIVPAKDKADVVEYILSLKR